MDDDAAADTIKGLTRDEWWDIKRIILPDADREEFDRDWDEFQRMKATKELH